MQNMENNEPFYYITESEMSTKVIRMMAPWLALGKRRNTLRIYHGMAAPSMTA